MKIPFLDKLKLDFVSRQGISVSFVVTSIFWLILFIFLMFYSPSKKETYKTIKITFEPVLTQKTEQLEKKKSSVSSKPSNASQAPSSPKELASPKQVNTTSKGSTPPVKQTQNVFNTTSATAPKKANKNIKYKKSVDELMAMQNFSSEKSNTWDESAFTENSNSSTSSNISSNQINKIAGNAALQGTAASSSGVQKSVSSVSSNNNEKGISSESTKNALGKISKANYSLTASEGVVSNTSIDVKTSSDGKIEMKQIDGVGRILLEPAKPLILISEENASLIDSTRNVKVLFTITAAGNVLPRSVEITPASALPLEIRSEVIDQIAKWRFSSANNDGQVSFEYSIIRK